MKLVVEDLGFINYDFSGFDFGQLDIDQRSIYAYTAEVL